MEPRVLAYANNMSQALQDLIAQGYDQTRRADAQVTERLRHHLQPAPGEQWLDVGCGTGNYTATLAQTGAELVGVDPSEEMLRQASEKYPDTQWVKAHAEDLPFADGRFDGAITTLSIHLWDNLVKGFEQIHRVVKPGGRLVIFTSMPHQMKRYWLNEYFPSVIEQSTRMMPGFDSLQATLGRARWRLCASEKFFVTEDLQDLMFYSGKHRPELYLESTVRSSISYFAAVENQSAVTEGLQRLKADLESGAFEAVRERYANGFGDYMFIVAEKEA
jgi:ubiquinone/menaquinone biosynthesis C-methylase UbiE